MTPDAVVPIEASNAAAVVTSVEPHADLWSDAVVLGLGWTARTVRELHIVAHGLVRHAVDMLGFRAVLIEGDRDAAEALDGFVSRGSGDPRSILAHTRPFLATDELLDLVLWLRDYNEHTSRAPVRIVHGGADDLSSPAALERSLANQVRAWYDEFEQRTVYLGGAAHLAVNAQRTLHGPSEAAQSAGALLRDHFGTNYRAIGLTFGRGTIPQPVPPPAPYALEALLDEQPYPTALVAPRHVLDGRAATQVRIVGPDYDPRDDPKHAMVGDPATWFDAIVHQKVATSVTFLQ